MLPLASKHLSLRTGDIADAIIALWDFEKENQVSLVYQIETIFPNGKPDLLITLKAFTIVDAPVVPVLLASVSVTCLSTNLKTLGAALTHALYAMDFQLVVHEFGGNKKES